MSNRSIASLEDKPVFSKTLLVLIILLISDSPLFMYTTNSAVSSIRMYILIMLPVIYLIKRLVFQGTVVNKRIFVSFSLVVICIFLSTLIASDSLNAFVLLTAKLLFAILLCSSCSFDEFKLHYIFVMRIIAVVSLIVYLLYQINPSMVQMLPCVDVYTSSGEATQPMVTVILTNVYAWGPSVWTIRNFGPFWEPGAFAAYLNFAILLVLFSPKDKRIKLLDIIIFVSALVSTVSSGGIICTLLIVLVFIISKTDIEHRTGIKVSIILISAIGAMYFSSNNLYTGLVSERLSSLDSGSTYSRLYSIWGNIVLFIRKPLFGHGIQSVDDALSEYYRTTGGTGVIHNTNTMLIYFSAFGVIAGVVFWRLWYQFATKLSRNRLLKMCIFIVIIVMLSNEDFTGSLCFMIIPMYSFYDMYRNQDVEADYYEGFMD